MHSIMARVVSVRWRGSRAWQAARSLLDPVMWTTSSILRALKSLGTCMILPCVRFLMSGQAQETVAPVDNPAPEWLEQRSWGEIQHLAALPTLSSFGTDFRDHLPAFRELFDSPSAHEYVLPKALQQKYSDLQVPCSHHTVCRFDLVGSGHEGGDALVSWAVPLCRFTVMLPQRLCILRCLRPDKVTPAIQVRHTTCREAALGPDSRPYAFDALCCL